MTDPTGHRSKAVGYLKAAVAIVVRIYLPGIAAGVLGSFGSVVFSGFVAGTITGGLQGGLEGAFGAPLFYGIGSHFMKGAGAKGSGFLGSGLKAGRFAQKVLAHATAGGVLSVLEGGKFGHGFVSAGVAEAGASTIDGNLHSSFAKVAASAMVGGSVSYLAGGKFGNGAATGAMQMAFNELADHQAMKKQRVKERQFLEGEITLLNTAFEDSLPWQTLSISQKDIGPAARTIGSTITFDYDGYYQTDFSSLQATYEEVQTFFHEVAHFWQYKNSNGGAYLQIAGRFLMSGGDPSYEYKFDISRKLGSYQREQQAEIIGDYGAANYFGRSSVVNNGVNVPIADYRKFLQNSGFPR